MKSMFSTLFDEEMENGNLINPLGGQILVLISSCY